MLKPMLKPMLNLKSDGSPAQATRAGITPFG